MNKQAKKILNLINKDQKSKKAYQKDPAKFLKSHGVDVDNLDPEFLKKISAGFWSVGVDSPNTLVINHALQGKTSVKSLFMIHKNHK